MSEEWEKDKRKEKNEWTVSLVGLISKRAENQCCLLCLCDLSVCVMTIWRDLLQDGWEGESLETRCACSCVTQARRSRCGVEWCCLLCHVGTRCATCFLVKLTLDGRHLHAVGNM